MSKQIIGDSFAELKLERGKLQVFLGNSFHQFRVSLRSSFGVSNPKHPIQNIYRHRSDPVAPCRDKALEGSFKLISGSQLQKGMPKISWRLPFFFEQHPDDSFAADKIV